MWLTSVIAAHVTLFSFLFAIIMSPTTDEYPDKERLSDFCKTQKVLFHVKVPRAAEHGISLQQGQRKCVEARIKMART